MLNVPVKIIFKHYQLQTGIQIWHGTKIGGGLTFPHYSCIVINEFAAIGRHCTIFQGVTIGGMRGSGSPTIGDNCILFAGVKIIGGVHIGNNCVIGAGAVVVHDIPDNSVAVGVPAKVISNNSAEVLKYY